MKTPILAVECNADRFFFEKLMNDKTLIYKGKNDTAVIGFLENKKVSFGIGIVDAGKNKKIPSGFKIIFKGKNTEIFKNECKYLVLIGSNGLRQFEHWINDFLKSANKKIKDFGYKDFDEFMTKESKTKEPATYPKFKALINFVLDNYQSHQNHVWLLKKQLDYIIKAKYNFDLNDFNIIK